ncbi:hypothetical protein MMC25_004985 [Agyrium rufum]|nr:hypothetical protein [Agyrium rufum]
MADSLPETSYKLKRNYAATTRLNCQFYLWKLELDFNLHPSIPKPSSDGGRIADVATGTGIWLLDVARELPGVQLDGFDISLEQCPPREWLPRGVNTHVWDMYTEVPEAMVGQFDVVHLRLLLLVVRDNDARPIIANAAKMLKPNGYIQWDEIDAFNVHVASTHPSAEGTTAFRKAQELGDFSTLEWIKDLPAVMNSNGFSDAVAHCYECDLSLAKYFQDMQLLVMEEEAERRFDSASERQKVYEQIRSIEIDSRKGLARCTPKVVFVARKSDQGDS